VILRQLPTRRKAIKCPDRVIGPCAPTRSSSFERWSADIAQDLCLPRCLAPVAELLSLSPESVNRTTTTFSIAIAGELRFRLCACSFGQGQPFQLLLLGRLRRSGLRSSRANSQALPNNSTVHSAFGSFTRLLKRIWPCLAPSSTIDTPISLSCFRTAAFGCRYFVVDLGAVMYAFLDREHIRFTSRLEGKCLLPLR
jgi:hypothetical protein